MTLIVDAGTLFAQADADDPEHEAVVALFEGEKGPLVTSQVAVAEADYLILTRLGIEVELAFLDDLAAGLPTGIGPIGSPASMSAPSGHDAVARRRLHDPPRGLVVIRVTAALERAVR